MVSLFLLLFACSHDSSTPPTCTLDPGSGSTLRATVGSASADSVLVSNLGELSAWCTLEDLVQPCADRPFDVSASGGFSLAPSASTTLNVVYHPEDLTSCVATLTLRCVPLDEPDRYCGAVDGGDISLGYEITLVGLPMDVDVDGDGYWSSEEADAGCDDEDATVYPGAPEREDLLDNDCDGIVDEGTALGDDDGDGQSEWEGDCDDEDASAYAGAPETAEGASLDVDNDCDGLIDEGTDYCDDDHDGWTEDQGDCNDSNNEIYPGRSENTTNLVDDNCQGDVDEGGLSFDDDGDGQSEADGDCDDSNADVFLGAGEIADGIDNDCDLAVDEGTASYDDDGDCYCGLDSSCTGSVNASCGSVESGDCDDGDSEVHPHAEENPRNDTDENCNGSLEY